MNFLTDVAPWLISCSTIASTHLIGVHYKHAYKCAVANVLIWCAWSVGTGNIGFIPLNIVLIIQYVRFDIQNKRRKSNERSRDDS